MDVLVIFYAVMIVLSVFTAGINFRKERPGLAYINIVCAVLLVVCLVLRLVG